MATSEQIKDYCEIIENINFQVTGNRCIYPPTTMIRMVFGVGRGTVLYHLNQIKIKYGKDLYTKSKKNATNQNRIRNRL